MKILLANKIFNFKKKIMISNKKFQKTKKFKMLKYNKKTIKN